MFCYAETGIIVNKKHKLLYKGKGHMAGQKKKFKKKKARKYNILKNIHAIFFTHTPCPDTVADAGIKDWQHLASDFSSNEAGRVSQKFKVERKSVVT